MDIFKEDDITIFAKTNFRGEERSFGIKLDDRRRHMYIIGKTGMGKSVMLMNLVIQDILKGKGVAFVDPHGDSADEILKFIPKHRVNDVVYFNPSDLQNPVAFNILEAVDEDHKHLIASGMMGVFKKIWPDVWSPRMEYILNNTILALLDFPGSTMLGINRMMADQNFRRQVIEKVRDPIVKSFWLEEFGKWDPRFAREATAAIQNKVGQFVSTPIVRHIVGQTTSTINMREIMDQKKILIVNLSKGRIGEEAMSLLGGMVVTRLYLAAMERVDIAEKERQDFFLYVDEFQNFATESFASILSEARKYRLSLIVAHQYIAQLTEEVRDAVFGNVGTLVTFRVGAADAEFMEKEFEPMVMMNDIINLPKYQIYLKLMIDGVTGNAFSAKTLPPFPDPITSYTDTVIKVSQERYGRPRKEVEDKITNWIEKEFSGGRPNPSQANYGNNKNYRDNSRPNENKFRPRPNNPINKEEKFMSPSQIIGFQDEASDKVEEKIKHEIQKSIPNNMSREEKPKSEAIKEEKTQQITSEELKETNKVLPDLQEEKKQDTPDIKDPAQKIDVDSSKIELANNSQNPAKAEEQNNQSEKKEQKSPTIWHEAVCDRCGKNTKVPFLPEDGREIFCKECLREVRRQRAISQKEQKERRVDSPPRRTPNNLRSKISDDQKEKLKNDLREMLLKLKAEGK